MQTTRYFVNSILYSRVRFADDTTILINNLNKTKLITKGSKLYQMLINDLIVIFSN